MTRTSLFTLLAAGLVAGCTGFEPPSRNQSMVTQPLTVSAYARASYGVRDIQIKFRPGMTVSEANSYFPRADIVWRGDPMGDRRAQIAAIFKDAFARGSQELDGPLPVVIEATVTRFHALTEKTRYTVGGLHNIEFDLVVRHAETGAIMDGPRAVNADLPGYGGEAAIRADAMGQTQKVRITSRLAQVLREELATPTALTDY